MEHGSSLRGRWIGGLAAAALCALATGAEAAQTVHLTLTIDGNLIEGESTITSLERANTIECSSLSWGVFVPYDGATGALTGRRQHRPVKFAKRIDKSTPLIAKALANNEPITDATFKFYRPNPTSGAEEHFYTITLTGGFIAAISAVSNDAIVAGPSAPPMMETVSVVYQTITWTYVSTGATHTDTWQGP